MMSTNALSLTFAHSRPAVERNPSAIKQMLLDWCKAQCAGYEVRVRLVYKLKVKFSDSLLVTER